MVCVHVCSETEVLLGEGKQEACLRTGEAVRITLPALAACRRVPIVQVSSHGAVRSGSCVGVPLEQAHLVAAFSRALSSAFCVVCNKTKKFL